MRIIKSEDFGLIGKKSHVGFFERMNPWERGEEEDGEGEGEEGGGGGRREDGKGEEGKGKRKREL